MSSLYNLEPNPTAKVILTTTAGDIELSLFAKQTPLASRNFLQHCLDGYYSNTLFHRLVPGFIVQGGDPSGTGSGGESAINHGEGFEDEVHSRLKFNRRGLLGMANAVDGAAKDKANGSQFFFTLAPTPELQGKSTMFGRVEGETIYNLAKIGEGVVEEGTERPMYPAKITGCDVVVNPFEDMVARVREAPRSKVESTKVVKKRKKPAPKGNVLSFADDGDEDLQPVKKKKLNPNFVDAGPAEPEELNNTKMPDAPAQKSNAKAQKPRSASPVARAPTAKPAKPSIPQQDSDSESDSDTIGNASPPIKKSKLDTTNEEIAALKASMKRTANVAPQEKQREKTTLESMIPATSTKGRKRPTGKGGDINEPGAFDAFQAFKAKLEGLPISKPTKTDTSANEGAAAAPAQEGGDAADEEEVCDLHFVKNCQSGKAWDEEEAAEEDDNDGDPSWMVSGLHFPKDTLGKDLEWKKQMAQIEEIDTKGMPKGQKHFGDKKMRYKGS